MAAEPIDDRDPGRFGSDSGADSGGSEYLPGDDQYDDDFDPRTSPFDGPDDFLNDLPAELREPYLRELWDGEYDPVAAGFLHRTGGQRGAGFAAGGALDTLEPGPVLAEFTAEAWAGGLDKRGESELIGVLCAWRRLASWAAAGEAATIIALARRRAAQARERQKPDLIDHVDAELAAALTLTGRGAGRLLELAHALSRLPLTMAALETGQIDWPRAVVMADELIALKDPDARKAEAIALPRAGELTTGQLRAALRRIVLLIDPEAVLRRREAARKDAAVQVWEETSGNSALAGRELPPAEAIAADKRITALADWLKGRGVTGTMDQLRAAVFTALLAGRPVSDLLPPAEAAADVPAPDGPAPGAPGPDGSAPRGGGPGSYAPGRHGRDAVAPGADDRVPANQSGLAGQPGSPVSSACADPGLSGLGDPGQPAGAPGAGTGIGSGWQPPVSGTVNLTMPLASWLGLSNRPGEVAGFGPADADTCRDLARWLAAHPATRWCVTFTDPGGHAVAHACARRGPGPPSPGPPSPGPPRPGPPNPDPHGSWGPGPPGADPVASWLARLRMVRLEAGDCTHRRESARYRPPPALRHLIKTRQRTCGFPGCRRSAVRCDLDHTVPYHLGGRTCECNMAALCRHHHQVKQAGGWSLAQPEPGVLVWSPPHGRTYQTRADPYPV